MDPSSESERRFSFPNADQQIPGASEQDRTEYKPDLHEDRPVVHIMDAINAKPDDLGEAKRLRTYQNDIAGTIKTDNVSMIKVALAEKKRQEVRGTYDQTLESQTNSKKLLVIGGVIGGMMVIALAAGGIFFIRSASEQQAADTAAARRRDPVMYTESSIDVNIDLKDSDDIERLIKREKDARIELGAMKAILLTTGNGSTTRDVTTAEFLAAMNTRAPDMLVRSLSPVFLLGVYAFRPDDTFAVFKVTAYDNAFAGMLEWEPYIENDLGGIFINRAAGAQGGSAIGAVSSVGATTTGTTTAASAYGLFSTRTFTDRVLINKDARVLTDPNGTQAMLYTFLDKDTLVISSSEKALKEIIFRVTTGKIIR